MISYVAKLKTAYETPQQAFARMHKRICAVTLESSDHSNIQVGQAREFRLTPKGDLSCLVEADEDRWALYQKDSLDGGANLFVGDLPIVGPVEE